MNAKAVLAELARGIQADTARCGALLPLLERQQRLLAATDAEGLAEVGSAIQTHLAALQESAGRRVRCLTALGLPADANGMKRLFQRLPASLSNTLSAQWQALEKALAQCKALNERNGELLATQRLILAELTGRKSEDYGSSEN